MDFFCPFCNSRLEPDAAFCTNCGKPVNVITDATHTADAEDFSKTVAIYDDVDFENIDYGQSSAFTPINTSGSYQSNPLPFAPEMYSSGVGVTPGYGSHHSDTIFAGQGGSAAGVMPYVAGSTAYQPVVGGTQTTVPTQQDRTGLIAGIVALVVGLLIVGLAMFFLITGGARSKHVVSFETYGGTVINALEWEKGTPMTSPNAPVREGYTFEGWYVDKDYSTPAAFPLTIDDDIVLYAKWAEKTTTDALDIGSANGYTTTSGSN